MSISATNAQPSTSDGTRTSAIEPAATFDRRHDLDALRAIAMLLGIVLHAALSFAPIPWTVRDSQQSDLYYLLFACIHGFRMPLFFMLSGFFTAMLWRKRGLAKLIKHRLKRILLPLVVGCLTIIPVMWVVSYIVARPSTFQSADNTIWQAVISGDPNMVAGALEDPNADVNVLNAESGSSPLSTAVFLGHTNIVEMLIKAEADVNLQNRDLATPIHIATFMGRASEADMLLQAGADTDARNNIGQTSQDLLKTDFATTSFTASQFGVQLEQDEWLAGRKEIAKKLGATDYLESDARGGQPPGLAAITGLLFYLPAFMHLWFLWFLCWLIVAFLGYTVIASTLPFDKLPRWLVCSPISLLWLIPLTMLPQAFMAPTTFGPDPSIGLLPIPSVLAYYAVFFFYGAVYWEMDDHQGQLGRWWYVSLPVALIIIFPVALDLVSATFEIAPRLNNPSAYALAGNFLQAMFAWLMVFGSIGLCRRFLSHESMSLRYISDSSYWLYLAHLPLVMLAQWLVRDLQIQASVKFAGITVAISVFLLITYEYGVRYTLIGRMLNGPRSRPRRLV